MLLVGDTTDAAAIASIKELLSWTPADLSGQLSFAELGALLEGCRLLIANDTGVMHLASAVGTPVVAIFGPSDHRMYGPYGPKGIAVYSRIACSPCFRRGRYPRCDNPVCMASIGVEEVWKAVEHQLDRTVVEDRQPSTLPINRGVS